MIPSLPAQYGIDPGSGNVGQWPGDDAYDKLVKYWCEAAFEEARYENNLNEDVKDCAKYMDYLVGKQWPTNRPTYKSKPINNRIWRLFWELVGTLTDVRPMFEIKSLRKDYDQQANIINQCTRSWWMNADADLTLAMVIVYALLCTGYAKLEWNPRLRNGEGDFDLIPLGPNDVLPLKPKHGLETAQATIYNAPMPLQWFRQKFPTRGYRVLPDAAFSRFPGAPKRPDHIPGMLFDMLSPQMKRIVGQNMQASQSMFPMAMYREFWFYDFQYNTSNNRVFMGDPRSNWGYWVEPGGPLYPRGRLIIMGGTEVMYDGPNPYWHARPPFVSMRMNVVPWQFHGLSEMRPLLPLQDIVNNILAGVLDMVKKAVNPSFLAPDKAVSDAVWNAIDWGMPGAKMRYNAQMSPTPPQFAPPPNLPAWVMNIAMLVAREMDASSGLASMSEAVRKKQVPAADTLEEIKQSQQTPLRLKGRNIEVFLRTLGTMNISNIFQFYTAERRLFMMGNDGLTPQDFDFDPRTMVPNGVRPEDHVRNFVFLVHPGTLLNINQVEKTTLLMKLRQQRDLDRNSLFKQLDIGVDSDTVEKNLDKENAHMLAQALQAKMLAGGMMGGQPGGQPGM